MTTVDSDVLGHQTCTFSACGTYRYRLRWTWDKTRARLLFVTLYANPLDCAHQDPAIRAMAARGRALGFGGIEVLCLYAVQAASLGDLAARQYDVGPENDLHITEAIMDNGGPAAAPVVCAWGSKASGHARATQVVELLRSLGCRIMAFSFDRDGVFRNVREAGSAETLVDVSQARSIGTLVKLLHGEPKRRRARPGHQAEARAG